MGTYTGVCKWFDSGKGFGFIEPDEAIAAGQRDRIFVHQSELYSKGFRSLAEVNANSELHAYAP